MLAVQCYKSLMASALYSKTPLCIACVFCIYDPGQYAASLEELITTNGELSGSVYGGKKRKKNHDKVILFQYLRAITSRQCELINTLYF